MDWRDLWPYARTWWGWTVGVCSVVFALYIGVRRVIETYEWYMYRLFDYKVKDFLEEKTTVPQLSSHGGQMLVWALPQSVSDIASATNISERRVLGCLRRLKKKHLIVEDGESWKIRI